MLKASRSARFARVIMVELAFVPDAGWKRIEADMIAPRVADPQ
jgi:hypothetical protein